MAEKEFLARIIILVSQHITIKLKSRISIF